MTFTTSILKASRLERDHPTFVHCILVGAAALTYTWEREDIVWRLIKDQGEHTSQFERGLFFAATILIGVGAYVCTATRTLTHGSAVGTINTSKTYLGQFVYAIGLATLFPLAGCLLLVLGEAVRLIRLLLSRPEHKEDLHPDRALSYTPGGWAFAVRAEAVKWGILVSMIVFTVTLNDSYADFLICASILMALVINAPRLWRRAREGTA